MGEGSTESKWLPGTTKPTICALCPVQKVKKKDGKDAIEVPRGRVKEVKMAVAMRQSKLRGHDEISQNGGVTRRQSKRQGRVKEIKMADAMRQAKRQLWVKEVKMAVTTRQSKLRAR